MSARDVLVACALKKEATGLTTLLPPEFAPVVTGLGTDRTLKSLEEVLAKRRPKVLIFTGMAGQLDPELQAGDVVLAREWFLESGTTFQTPEWLAEALTGEGWRFSDKAITVQVPVIRKSARLELFKTTGARICDMESAAAHMVAASKKVPCLAIKVVSDTAESGMMGFYRRFDRNLQKLAEALEPLIRSVEKILRD